MYNIPMNVEQDKLSTKSVEQRKCSSREQLLMTRRDFTLNPAKYLNKPGEYTLTGRVPVRVTIELLATEEYIKQLAKEYPNAVKKARKVSPKQPVAKVNICKPVNGLRTPTVEGVS